MGWGRCQQVCFWGPVTPHAALKKRPIDFSGLARLRRAVRDYAGASPGFARGFAGASPASAKGFAGASPGKMGLKLLPMHFVGMADGTFWCLAGGLHVVGIRKFFSP
jgi:hypothetical protein